MNTNEPLVKCPTCQEAIPTDAPRGLCPKCVLARVATATGTAPALGNAEEPPTVARVAAAFPQLEVLELIGRGGMGFVYKARQPHLDRFVALKLLPDRLARDAQFTERFNREGRVLGKLSHPNIVSVFDFGRAEAFYFLLMEYVDGVNLRQAMRAGRFTPAEALGIVPRICEALQYAHEQGVLHRDIKPENILIDSRGRVKIADFGIAKLVGEAQPPFTLTATGASLGTPHYMAPEQLESPAAVDQRADIYSLGVVFYEMLTGELPLGRFAPPSQKTPVGSALDEVVFRTLEKDREKRYQTAGEVRTQVEQLAGNPQAEREPSEPEAQPTLSSDPEAPAGYAFRAIAGALMVGVSWVAPLGTLMALLTQGGGVGPGELWLSVGSVALPGVGGTLVGWLGLNDIRESGGRLKGLPFALFATLAWPLAVLVVLTVGIPMFTITPAGPPSLLRTLARLPLVLLPAGVFTFCLWSVYTTARWAQRRPAPHERGVLKWIFAGLLAFGFALILLTRGNAGASHNARPVAAGVSRDTEPHDAAVVHGEAEADETPMGERLAPGLVDLVSVSDGSTNHVWRPDGSPYTEIPFDAPKSRVSDSSGRIVDLVFLCQASLGEDVGVEWVIRDSRTWVLEKPAVRSGVHVRGSSRIMAAFPPQLDHASVLAKVASGPWETMVKDISSPGTASFGLAGKLFTSRVLSIVGDDAGNTVVTLTHNVSSHQARLVALTEDGAEHSGDVKGTAGDGVVFLFPKLTRNRIQKFQFQVRPYRWTEFKDIALRPRSETEP